jgi:hypothetical protein
MFHLTLRLDPQFFYAKAIALVIISAISLYIIVMAMKRPRLSQTERMVHSLTRCRKVSNHRLLEFAYSALV